MLDEKMKFDDNEDDVYIPDIAGGDLHEWKIADRSPRSNAGVALEWSNLEQQIFDLLLLNRFVTDDHDTMEDQVDAIKYLLENFDLNEIVRIGAVALLAKQMEATEDKNFLDEYEKYKEHIRKNPSDADEGLKKY